MVCRYRGAFGVNLAFSGVEEEFFSRPKIMDGDIDIFCSEVAPKIRTNSKIKLFLPSNILFNGIKTSHADDVGHIGTV